MVQEYDGLETAYRLLQSSDMPYGFAELWARGRQDLAVEAFGLQPDFPPLSIGELETAHARLGR